MVPLPDDLNARWQEIRTHPDFSFGVVFTKRDWPAAQEPPGLDQDELEQRVSNTGYDLIDEYKEDHAGRSSGVHEDTPRE